MKYSLVLSLLILIALVSCSPKEKDSPVVQQEAADLGTLQHDFKLRPETQEKFDEGLLLLHNFEYEDALAAFEEATASDSTEVMTHWGEAMSHYKALWRLQNTEKGKAILARLGASEAERLAAINDPLKQRMWKMVEIMYGEGDFDERNKALSTYLADLHSQYPKHQEIAAFYALSLIWSTEEYGDGSADLRLAAATADKVLKMNPKHPGALHYKIHALDGPTSAEEAHAAADAYAKVAPAAAHALHMPSHIYLAIGEWNSVVESNQVSYDASVARMEKKGLGDGARGYHSLAWLHYGLLQQERFAEAAQILNDMLTLVPKDPTKGARGYLVGMQTRQLYESGTSPSTIQFDTEVSVDDIGINAQAMRSFLRAQLAYENKNVKTLSDEIKWLKNKIFMASQQVQGDGVVMCAAGTSRYAPTENGIKMADVVLSQIKGMKALLEGQPDQFEKFLKEAVALEDQTNYPAGPPRVPFPSFEQYGEWLLTQGEYTEAIKQFDNALKRMPKRSKSLRGKMAAYEALDQKKEVEKMEQELSTILAVAN
jgi:tetratricopeptide (TPR) repeat protein